MEPMPYKRAYALSSYALTYVSLTVDAALFAQGRRGSATPPGHAGVVQIGAKDCSPEINTSEIIVDVQRCVIFRPDQRSGRKGQDQGLGRSAKQLILCYLFYCLLDYVLLLSILVVVIFVCWGWGALPKNAAHAPACR